MSIYLVANKLANVEHIFCPESLLGSYYVSRALNSLCFRLLADFLILRHTVVTFLMPVF